MDPLKLKDIVKKAPHQPGIYQFKDKGGKAIYIGKAHLLNQRLKSYCKPIDFRIRAMITEASSLSFTPTNSDIEALILESQFIKTRKPKYNIVMRDDKRYSFVAFTKEDFSKIYIAHQIKEGAEYIGPFTEGSAIRSTLKYLRKIFPYCTCSQRHNRRCLNAHIGKCLGFCCLKDSKYTSDQKKDYQRNIKAIRDILDGKKNNVLKRIESEMKAVANKGDFDRAILLRETISRLNRVFDNARIIRKTYDAGYAINELSLLLDMPLINRVEGYDISNIQGQMAVGSMVVFEKGVPNSDEYRLFNIKTVSGSNDTEMLKEILTRRFNHPEWPNPDLILIDGGRGQLNISSLAIPKNIKIISLTKDEKHVGSHIYIRGNKNPIKLADISEPVKNMILSIDNEAHRFAINSYRKKHRKKMR